MKSFDYKFNFNIIKLNNISEDSKGEDSFNNSSISKKNQDSYLRLPKIAQKNKMFGGIGALNFMNSNEFKKSKNKNFKDKLFVMKMIILNIQILKL